MLIRFFIAWNNEDFKRELGQNTLIVVVSAIIVIAFVKLVSC